MSTEKIDVIGIGNALVDVIIEVANSVIEELGLAKGSMNLIDEERAQQILGYSTQRVISAGGSAANTMVGVASFGGRSCFAGSVANDDLGAQFVEDIEKAGVAFVAAEEPGCTASTGTSTILLTSDAQRTMNTHLGAASFFSAANIDTEVIASSKITFFEGYLWDKETAKKSMVETMRLTKSLAGKVAFSLSDSFCVERHRQDFLELLHGPIDILFANEDEITALYSCELEIAIDKARSTNKLICVTRGEEGSILVSRDEIAEVAAEVPKTILDTTGAGDQYAAGVLYGLSQGLPLSVSGKLGSLAAAEVISHFGARPQEALSQFLEVSKRSS